MSVDMGKDASFTCAWRGNPLPRITWTRLGSSQVKFDMGSGTLAGSGLGCIPSVVSDTPSLCQVLSSGPTLRLPSVALEDAGDYVCRAEPRRSGLGGGTAQARLTVNGERPRGSWGRGWAERACP